MSTSYSVYGVKPADEKWKRMKAAYDACRAAGVRAPDEVTKFFKGESPDPKGVIERLGGMHGDRHPCVSLVDRSIGGGFEIDITKLPADVTIIRFLISS